MKILRLLSKNYFLIFLFSLFLSTTYAEEQTVDIWEIDKEKTEKSNLSYETSNELDLQTESKNNTNIYQMQNQVTTNSIEFDNKLISQDISLYGLYDPEDFGLDINMWSNSDGDQLKGIFSKLEKIKFSKDASEIVKVSMLTNAYFPKKNISESEFLEFKSNWLIKNSDLNLIEDYLIKNQIINKHEKLTKFLVDQYLSVGNIDKSCEILFKNNKPIQDIYLLKFDIYCLIHNNKKEEAQLLLDLKKETGFKDKYFESKINYLLGYSLIIDNSISEKNILDFHLAHVTNKDFNFEPNEKTKKIIWKYLSSSNLLDAFNKIEVTELKKISTLEKATHNKDYPEEDLFRIYKYFQFTINQLLNAEQKYKSLPNIEARALIYQKILLESEITKRLELLKILKKSFENDKIGNAFDLELKKFLDDIDPKEIPDNLTSFYYTNINIKENNEIKIKFNNDILHQSKLVNYFNGDYSKSKIEKDVNNFLKKIKKNKKYFISTKDKLFLESLKFDGIKISEKFDNMYELDRSEIPSDIQVMINNNEKGAALLRIAEVIGQDKLERIDDDTIYFIIATLNELNIFPLRNKILLKVLPLKV